MADKASVHVDVSSDLDVVTARHEGRTLAQSMGFSAVEVTLIATAISEIARNIAVYAGSGEVSVGAVMDGDRSGIRIVASDVGPGIPDIEQALRDGYSTGKSLGLGLPGAKRLMDEFEVVSRVGEGTTVTMKKWKR